MKSLKNIKLFLFWLVLMPGSSVEIVPYRVFFNRIFLFRCRTSWKKYICVTMHPWPSFYYPRSSSHWEMDFFLADGILLYFSLNVSQNGWLCLSLSGSVCITRLCIIYGLLIYPSIIIIRVHLSVCINVPQRHTK